MVQSTQVQLQPPAAGELRFAVAESRNPVLSRAVSECVQVSQDKPLIVVTRHSGCMFQGALPM
jgi:hypothetical protein